MIKSKMHTGTNSVGRLTLTMVTAATLVMSAHAFGADIKQKSFATPEDAVTALVSAVKADNRTAQIAVLGNARGDLSSGDAVADRAIAQQFIASYDQKHALATAGDRATLTIGNDDFPFAFPLVKTGERWRFDTAAGKNEMLARRIGENELDAIKVLQAIVDAQRDYAAVDRDGDGVRAYARKFLSGAGKHDGLYWKTNAGDQPSPLGELVVRASTEGYRGKQGTSTPYHGYYYRMLKGQAAQGEAPKFDYVVNGRAIGGFAVVAYPAKYGSSGIMTFIVNQDGEVYQSDLGPQTTSKALSMERFDPAKRFAPVRQ